METIKIKLALLIFDFGVYPRHKILDYNVSALRQVIRSGKEMDPIVWDKKTKIILDGFHRVTAFKKEYGLDYEIEGYEIECKDRAEMVVKSTEYNSKHGVRLCSWDQARCINLARVNNIKKQIMQGALGITKDRYEILEKRNINIKDKNGNIIGKTQLKRGQEKIAQKEDGIYVTEKEAEDIEGNSTTGLKAEVRIKTLIKDIDMNNFTITNKNIDMIKEFIALLEGEVENYERNK